VKSHFYFLENDKVSRHHCELSKDERFSKQLFQNVKWHLKMSFPEITVALRLQIFKKSMVYFSSNRLHIEIIYTKVFIFKAFFRYELLSTRGVMLKQVSGKFSFI